ncbi:MAG: hypothetical protein Q8K63_09165 [Acidimicrobiales bacterium]|nr:hypothetical protein [Acidimicrobiales bacterium]
MRKLIPGVSNAIRLDDPIPDDDAIVRSARQTVNAALFGRLEVDYDTRRVTLPNIPGDVAMRVHAIISEYRAGDPSSARWSDTHDPRTADAGCGLLTFDVTRVLTVRWYPERLVPGDHDGTESLALAISVVTAYEENSDPVTWEQSAFEAYLRFAERRAHGRSVAETDVAGAEAEDQTDEESKEPAEPNADGEFEDGEESPYESDSPDAGPSPG